MIFKIWTLNFLFAYFLALIYEPVRDFYNDTFKNQELWKTPSSLQNPILQCGFKWFGGLISSSEYFSREIDTTGIPFAASEISVTFLFIGKWIQDKISIYINNNLIESISSDTQVDHKCQYCEEPYEQSIMKKKLKVRLTPNFKNSISFSSAKPIYFREFTVSYAFCPPVVSIHDMASLDYHACKCVDGYFRDFTTSNFKCLKCPVFCKTCTGRSRSECLECSTGFHKVNGACVSEKSKYRR